MNLASCPPTMGRAKAFPPEAWAASPPATRRPSARPGATELLVCTATFLKLHFRTKVLSHAPPAQGTSRVRKVYFPSCAVNAGQPPCTVWPHAASLRGRGGTGPQHALTQASSAGEMPGQGVRGCAGGQREEAGLCFQRSSRFSTQ